MRSRTPKPTSSAPRRTCAGCQARLETANQNLEYTRISAPFDGWVGLSAVSTGNLVNLETGTLAKVVKTDPMRVEFVITEMDILKMHEFRKDGRNPDVKVSLSFQDGTVLSDRRKNLLLEQ